MTPTCSRLTDREEAVLRRWMYQDKEIAAELHISPKTVDAHMRRIFAKLGVQRRQDAAREAGLLVDVA